MLNGLPERPRGGITLQSAIDRVDLDGGGEIDFNSGLVIDDPALPAVTVGATINGVTIGSVVISGSPLDFTAGGSTAEYLVINGSSGDGIDMSGGGNKVLGDYIGTDQTGMNAAGNAGSGIYLYGSNNTISGCVISANAYSGISIDGGSNNLVVGNLIGTDVAGTKPLGNVEGGVEIFGGASHNTIGGTAASARNLISGNATPTTPTGYAGLDIYGAGTIGNIVEGNFIGTDITGTVALGNANDGLAIFGGAFDQHRWRNGQWCWQSYLGQRNPHNALGLLWRGH